MPLLIALSGFKNSGKTTLALALLKEILSEGLVAGYVKHTEKDVLSPPETDTGRVAPLGVPCLCWGRDGAVWEVPAGEIERERIQGFFPGKDIVLVEGAKRLPLARVWVGSANARPEDVKNVFACFDISAAHGDGSFLFAPGEEKKLTRKILELYRRTEGNNHAELFVQGKRIPLKSFVTKMIAGCLSGLILPLKGVNSLKGGVEIHLKCLK